MKQFAILAGFVVWLLFGLLGQDVAFLLSSYGLVTLAFLLDN